MVQERKPLDVVGGDPASSAAEALRLAAVDPVAARALGKAVLVSARYAKEWAVVSVAERALGVATMTLGELDLAIEHLRAAVVAGQQGRSRQCTGEARMSLASALVMRGLRLHAQREINLAIGDPSGLRAARALVQRAAVLQELGRIEEALDDLRRALPVLNQARDGQWAVRALSNRSLLHVARRSFTAAETDLVRAMRLCAEHGLELPGAIAEQNLGCVKAQRGDVAAALRHFDAAEERYRRFGLVKASLLVDRAELLLSVRLVDEARATAEAAVVAYDQQRHDVRLPEAQLLLSTVALVQGDGKTAISAAGRAVRGFRRVGRRESLALARYAQVQALLAVDRSRGASPGQLRRVADELAAAGWAVPALDARVLAGRLALERGRRAEARRDLATASRARAWGPADARARAWLAEGLLRRADGRRPEAVAAVCAGLRVVEEHQATLGATELRAHVSLHRGSLARLGMRMALEDGEARRVLWWAERGRASALRLRPVRPPEDPVLAEDLADLRATMGEIEQARAEGDDDGPLVRRQVSLERSIRDRCRTVETIGRAVRDREPSVRDLLAELRDTALGDAALVEYVELDGELSAVVLAGGRASLHALGPVEVVRHALEHVPFALHRLANPATRTASRDAATTVVRRAAAVLDGVLAKPLAARVQDRPLVVVPIGALQSLPWSIMPSCSGRPVTVSPSATLWYRAMSGEPPPCPAPVVVVAGPGLPGAQEEAEAVAALHPGSVRLLGGHATAPALQEVAAGAALLHLAAHGAIRSDNPLFSALRLADGPYTVYDLERLPRPPHHVVLAACDVARPHLVGAGEEILGFGAALLGGGTATLVAPVVPVPDAETAPLMRAYHERLRADRPPAEALAAAQLEVCGKDPVASAAAAGFVCLGAGLAPAGRGSGGR